MTIDEKIKQAAEEYSINPYTQVDYTLGANFLKSEMLADMQKLVDALEFYADKLNWRTNSGKIGITPLTNGCDAEIIDRLFTGGKRARQALTEFNAKYKGEK